jgi:hypothetical protein
VAEQLSSTRDTSLNLITDQQHIVLVAQSSGLLEVIVVWDNNSRLALDGLNQECSQVRARLLKRLAQSSLVIILDWLVGSWNCAANVGDERAIVLSRLGVRGQGDCDELKKNSQRSTIGRR